MPITKRFSLPGAATLLLVALTGCDTTNGGPPTPQATSAYFSARPDQLLAAARAACSGPGESFHRPRPGVMQCHLLLDPEATASAILNFDGSIDDLPQLVISLHSAPSGTGHLVTGCAFLKVPQKSGAVKRIVYNDRGIDQRLRQMLDGAGGQALASPPAIAIEHCLSL